MTEKLFTGTLNRNQNKNKNKLLYSHLISLSNIVPTYSGTIVLMDGISTNIFFSNVYILNIDCLFTEYMFLHTPVDVYLFCFYNLSKLFHSS